jgi:putative ABC transport system substrate-binding protein
MSRKIFIWLLSFFFLTTASTIQAQSQTKVSRIGVLRLGSRPDPQIEAFLQSLRALGYIEGKNLAVTYRYAEGKLDRLPELAAELVNLKVDIIVTATVRPTRAAMQATSSIPIVFATGGDPVTSGIVASLAQPGGNATGLSNLSGYTSGKRLELLKEALPAATRLAALWDTSGSNTSREAIDDTQAAARALKVRIQVIEVHEPKELAGLFASAKKGGAQAMTVVPSPLFFEHRKTLVELALKHRLPGIYEFSEFPELGGLMSYSANLLDMYRRAAVYVDKILKGTKPADLPVEQPMKFELVINLKTAKQIGVTIAPNLLVRADRVIR